MNYLYPNYLTDSGAYAKAEAFWLHDVWERTPEIHRRFGGWRAPWFAPSPPSDGNPIFTAVSDSLRKGVRVIQYEPLMAGDSLELDFWLGTFGGRATDPDAIQELVVACSLSVESAVFACKVISAWLIGSIEVARSSDCLEGFVPVQHRVRQRRTEIASLRGRRPLLPAA